MEAREENERLAQVLDILAIEFRKDRFRKQAYENAATAVRRHDKVITSGSQAQREIKGIGKSIAKKIDEILATGTLAFLQRRPEAQVKKSDVIKEFTKIYGVGPKTAEKWYDKGYTSFESLKKLLPEMTEAQRLGYKYFDDINQRIPRSEMTEIDQRFKEIFGNKVKFMLAGSYRRGEVDSGDVDLLVQATDDVNIDSVVRSLKDNKLILGTLAKGADKFMGIMRLKPKYKARRIDVRVISGESWPYATLYFTGSKQLNVEMRTRAQSMGLTMNEYRMTDKKGKKYLARTEKDIFDYLGMEYLLPTERSVVKKVPKKKVLKKKVPKKKAEKEPEPIKVVGGTWYNPSPTLFVYVSDDLTSTGNIAGFDLDGTLVRTKRGMFPRDPQDITLLPNRLDKLKELKEKGYDIVIFTNQRSKSAKKRESVQNRMKEFVNLIPNLPIILLAATGDDKYRKPNIGMWEVLRQMVANVNPQTSFFTGDAGGKPEDFSDSDKIFAENIGITFYTPDQIFYPLRNLTTDKQVDEIILPEGKNMVLFVGAPGTGKSTYYNNNLKDLGYVHINQDELKTKAKMLRSTRDNMKQGLNIVIDATNPGQKRREEFYDLAKKNDYNITVIYFVRDGRGWNKLRAEPVPNVAYGVFYKYLNEPTPENTPGTLYELG